MVDQPPRRYTVTYAFNGYLRGEYATAISRIRETVAELQHEDVDIEFLGATQVINGAGQLVTVTASFKAPSKGAIGLLNCRAILPACGPPQATNEDEIMPDTRNIAVTNN